MRTMRKKLIAFALLVGIVLAPGCGDQNVTIEYPEWMKDKAESTEDPLEPAAAPWVAQ